MATIGRPTEYKEEYIKKVDEYLESHQDTEVQVIKGQSDDYTNYETKLKVRLPTIEGFAMFLDVSKKVLYDWEKQYPKFLHALDKIRTEQHDRLIDNGLSGNYNSTIAKLMLSHNHGYKEKSDVTSNDKTIKGNSVVFADFDEDETNS
jgi:hypothetical protein